MVTTFGFYLSGVIAIGIIFIGGRFLLTLGGNSIPAKEVSLFEGTGAIRMRIDLSK